MPQTIIENPILNSPYREPTRHFRFDATTHPKSSTPAGEAAVTSLEERRAGTVRHHRGEEGRERARQQHPATGEGMARPWLDRRHARDPCPSGTLARGRPL